MIEPTSYLAGPEMDRFRSRALWIGIVALGLSALAGLRSPAEFMHSYLLAFLFWTGLALGCLAIAMLHRLTGGNWGMIIRRVLESGSRTLPLMALLFVPIYFGRHWIYGWTHPLELPRQQLAYLNVRFFLARAALYFLIWVGMAHWLSKWSREQDRTGDPQLLRRMQLLSGPGLVVYALTTTFAAVDWMMSLEPRWYSTIFGLLVVGGQLLSALAFAIVMIALLSTYGPLGRVLEPWHVHDLGKLLLAFVMVWAYLAFSQLLIIWSGNLPEEIPWYLNRLEGGWRWVGVALILFHFALPFSLLLSRDLKRRAPALALVAILVLVMRVVDLFWLTAPEFSPGQFRIDWMDIAVPIGVGGIWLAFFARELKTRPLLPVRDPELAAALEEEHG
ncbi:MAG TPA: hypothetical protein VKE24_05030 [Candidatus Acidoferrales bacterium]|nr:hypothetical protein [Candidatus Acidoferrales bacterium]